MAKKLKKSKKFDLPPVSMLGLQRSRAVKFHPPKWWEKESVEYAFSYPPVRSRLEQLMGSNIVVITDRRYMQRLQERIREEHIQCITKRIKDREEEELDREKRLVLEGKLPMETFGKVLAGHPVYRVTQISSKIVEIRRSKDVKDWQKLKSAYGPAVEEVSLVGAEEAALVRGLPVKGKSTMQDRSEGSKEETVEPEVLTQVPLEEGPDNVALGYMFTQEEYDRLKYESPLIKQLRQLETVEELYELADEIVGPIRACIKKSK